MRLHERLSKLEQRLAAELRGDPYCRRSRRFGFAQNPGATMLTWKSFY